MSFVNSPPYSWFMYMENKCFITAWLFFCRYLDGSRHKDCISIMNHHNSWHAESLECAQVNELLA